MTSTTAVRVYLSEDIAADTTGPPSPAALRLLPPSAAVCVAYDTRVMIGWLVGWLVDWLGERLHTHPQQKVMGVANAFFH